MGVLSIRTADTTLIDRVDWSGVEERDGARYQAGPAELMVLRDLLVNAT